MPSQKRLRELFDYKTDTGVLTRKIKTSNNARVGVPIGSFDKNGYLIASVDGKHRPLHRVIWTMLNGPIPQGLVIDHINGIPNDNRIINLRCVTHAVNARNSYRSISNTTGVTGIYKAPKIDAWIAAIHLSTGKIHLGTFDTKAEAIAARRAAELIAGYHPNHGRVLQ